MTKKVIRFSALPIPNSRFWCVVERRDNRSYEIVGPSGRPLRFSAVGASNRAMKLNREAAR